MEQPTVFELYRLCVEMADRVSARRTAANSFFLTLHTVLLGAFGFFGGSSFSSGREAGIFFFFVIGVAGLLLSAAWWLLLKSYRDLNAAKFAVINSMEASFPIQPYTQEWEMLQKDRVKGWRKRYAEQGVVERLVPGIVGCLYVILVGGLVLTS